MSQANNDLALVENWISSRRKRPGHRQLVWVSGDQQWTLQVAERLLSLTKAKENIWLGEWQNENLNSHTQNIEHNHVRGLLGSEYDNAVYNADKQFNLNSLFAVAGTVKANGLLLLLSPLSKEWATTCRCLPSQSHGFTSDNSHFLHHFTAYLSADRGVIKLFQNGHGFNQHQLQQALIEDSAIQPEKNNQALLPEQTKVADALLRGLTNSLPYAATLVAKRGRGKSWLLGWLIKALINRRYSIALIAPRSQSTNQVFAHLSNFRRNPMFTYCAPDDDSLRDDHYDIIIVDEAAAIPLSMLRPLVSNHTRCVFSTTTGGYEGSGGGFNHRFISFLARLFDNHFEQFQLTTPLRWYQGDYLEKTIDGLLEPVFPCPSSREDNVSSDSSVLFNQVKKHQLLDQPSLALKIHTLLTLAHYQTTPNDFIRQFDAQDCLIFTLTLNLQIVAAALCIVEGGQKLEGIENEVASGARRVKGHLTPQYLSYNTTESNFCHLTYLRINRIAVMPGNQGSGFGSMLLSKINEFARASHFDLLSTSFGSTPRLNTFWERNLFSNFSIGQKIDKASGEYSALYLCSLTPKARELIDNSRILKPAQHTKKILDFINGTRNFSSAREAIQYYLKTDPNKVENKNSEHELLAFIGNTIDIDEATIVNQFKFNGKKQLSEKLKKVLSRLLNNHLQK